MAIRNKYVFAIIKPLLIVHDNVTICTNGLLDPKLLHTIPLFCHRDPKTFVNRVHIVMGPVVPGTVFVGR